MTENREPERGHDPAAEHDNGWGPRLAELCRDLSPGDASVLLALLEPEEDASADKAAMTTRGSPNDWVMAHLSRVNMLEEAPDIVPAPLQARNVGYRITASGRKTLPFMLPHFLRKR